MLEGNKAPTGQPSSLRLRDIQDLCQRVPFPWGTVLALPKAETKMTNDFAPFFPISVHALDGGFRLPLSKLGVDLCCHMGVNPGQLHPNT